MGSDGVAAADGIDPFVGFPFNLDVANRNFEQLGDRRAHGFTMRSDLGRFGDHYGVDIDDLKSGARDLGNGFREHGSARNIFNRFV